MRNFCILAASLALFGCASVNTEKSQTQTAAKKSDSDAFMILAEGFRNRVTFTSARQIPALAAYCG